MANKKSAKKRALTNEKSRMRNVARRSDIKTASKKVLVALAASDITGAQTLLREAESKIARAKGKGVLKANTAARKISLLAKKVHAAQAGTTTTP
ncbi:30S ribosomal protein S20 [Candidatus Dependentiae bacterium]|nr:30S ribosomal protein S20 [Candidatus Dependentiae bacterium]